MELSKTQIDKFFKDIHSGKITIENIPVELSKYTYDELMPFVAKGFGEIDSTIKNVKINLYKKNISAFSGAKSFQEVNDMTRLSFLSDGSKRPFKEFKEYANTIKDQYNVNWLKTEQNTAFSVAQSADKWQNYEKDKYLFPVLQYKAVDDERIRDEHLDWDNLKFPVDSSFWDTRMPPNGFNCRCMVIQLTEGKVDELKGQKKNTSKQFSNNAGKTDYIYDPKKHPYFKHTKKESQAFNKAIAWESKE